MVAISLYRGNLHRVPQEPPRRWLMPTPRISLKDFRRLNNRRTNSLSLLPSSSSAAVAKPRPSHSYPPPLQQPTPETKIDGDASGGGENPNLCLERIVDDSVAVYAAAIGGDVEMVPESKENEADDRIAVTQVNGNLDAIDEKEERKKEIEEKLQILNEKKHNLVQALKQILNAEEELKRRSSVQANRPPLPVQVDVSNDSGSMTRHATPRTGSDVNVPAEVEGGDDAGNHNPPPRKLLRVNSTSPSAESALRKPPIFQHSSASYPSRAAMVAAGSPSLFALSGNHDQSSSMPTVSGTNYIPSSPSPAASGGTSCFRDARHPSP